MTMNNDFDLEQLATLLDSAINSDVPSVKKALSNFLMIAALCNTDDESKDGMRPFTTLIRDIARLNNRVNELEAKVRSSEPYGARSYATSPYVNHNPVYDYSTIERLQQLADFKHKMPNIDDPSTIFTIKTSK
jgi:hypothetical protein